MNRRHFLRGLGVCLGLPALESLPAAVGAAGAPVRVAFLYAPNGRNMPLWTPKETGRSWGLTPTLEPFSALRGEIQILSGLDHEQAKAHGDGPGDHSRASAAFLTGVHPRKTAGTDLKAGRSVDQLMAEKLGAFTRLPSLELTCDNERAAGRCDAGYACAYQYNLSWKSESTPMTPEASPRAVFERLFSTGPAGEGQARRAAQKKSVLDFALGEARSLQSRLPAADRQKLDEYLTAVREVERQIEQAEKFAASAPPTMEAPPAGVPGTYAEHLRLHFDLMALAFQTDSTRVATFLMSSEGSNRTFGEIGVPDSHHFLSHHQENAEKLARIAMIDRFYSEHVAYLLQKLKSMPDARGGSVLDNSMILYGCGIADGNAHAHDDLPLLLAGRGGGRLTPGQHLAFSGASPVTNLYRTLLDRMGMGVNGFGDSTGLLDGI